MPIVPFPKEPEKRRLILIANRGELQKIQKDPKYSSWGSELLLNEQLYLLSYPVTDTNDIIKELDNCGLLNPGTLLIQNPYNSLEYTEAVEAFSTFALAKYLHFSYFCNLLGAKRVSIEKIEMKTNEGKILHSGTLKSPYLSSVGGDIEFEKSVWEKINSRMSLNDNFSGSEPDISAATDYLNKYRLQGDLNMKTLLDMRAGPNQPKSREITLSLTRESRKNIKAAFSLDIPIYADLKQQIENIKKESYDFTLLIKVDF